MKFGRKAKTGAVILTLLCPALIGVFSPSEAGTPSTAPLIDKDFEVAMRKFISKRFFNRIDATADQREKLSKIIADTQDETRPRREEFRQGLVELSDLVADDKSSDEQIKAKVAELRAVHEKVQDRRLSAILEARKILNAEQRQQIHTRVIELLTGGIKPRRIGMLIQAGSDSVLGD